MVIDCILASSVLATVNPPWWWKQCVFIFVCFFIFIYLLLIKEVQLFFRLLKKAEKSQATLMNSRKMYSFWGPKHFSKSFLNPALLYPVLMYTHKYRDIPLCPCLHGFIVKHFAPQVEHQIIIQSHYYETEAI